MGCQTVSQLHALEQWEKIDGFPSYAVSSLGRIMRVKKGKTIGKCGHILAQRKDSCGYMTINLAPGRKTKLVHILVADAFKGKCPDGLECHHIDGDKSNPAVSNLEYVSRKEHKSKHFYLRKGFAGKLTPQEVIQVRELMTIGASRRYIARRYDISQTNLWRIVRKIIWKNI